MTTHSNSTSASGRPSEPPLRRSFVGRVTRLVVGVSLAAILLIALAIGAAQTPIGQRHLAALASRGLSVILGDAVLIEGIGDGFPVRLSLDRLRIGPDDAPWLELDQFRLAWRPARLIAGVLDIAELRAARLRIATPPPSAESEPDATSATLLPPRLPIGLRLERLAVDRLELDPSILGEPATLTIEGRVGARQQDGWQTELSVRQVEGGESDARLSARWRSDGVVDVDFLLQEREGGIVTRLLGLSPYPSMMMTVQGSGPIDNWHGDARLVLEDLGKVEARLRLSASPLLTFVSEGRAEVAAAVVPPPIQPALRQGIEFSLSLHEEGDRLVIDQLALTAGEATVEASGSLALTDERIAGRARVTVGAPAIDRAAIAPLEFRELDVTADLSGTLARPAAVLHGRIEQVGTTEFRTGTARWTLAVAPAEDRAIEQAIAVRLDLAVEGLAMDDARLQTALGRAASLSTTALLDVQRNTLAVQGLKLAAADAEVTGDAVISLVDDGSVDGTMRARLVDLSRFAPFVGLPLAGAATIDLTARGPVGGDGFSAELNAAFARFALGEATVDAVLGAEPRLGVQVRSGKGGVELEPIRLIGKNGSIDGGVAFDDAFRSVQGQLRVSVTDAAAVGRAIGVDLQGTPRVDVRLSGPLADPAVAIRSDLGGLVIDGMAIRSGDATIEAARTFSEPAGRMRLRLLLDEGTLALSASYRVTEWRLLSIPELSGEVLGLPLSGATDIALDRGTVAGRLRLKLPEEPVAVAGESVQGQGAVEIHLADDAGQQRVTVTMAVSDATLGPAADPALRIERLAGHATIADVLGHPRVVARLSADALVAAPHRFEQARIELEGSREEGRVSLMARNGGEVVRRVTADGRWVEEPQGLRFTLRQLDSDVGGHPVTLETPATLIRSAAALTLRELRLRIGEGLLAADGQVAPRAAALSFQADRLPLGLIGALAGETGVRGVLDGGGDLALRPGSVTGAVDINVRDARLATSDGVDLGISSRAAARFVGNAVEFDGSVRAPGDTLIEVTGRVPLRIPGGADFPLPQIETEGALAARATVRGDLAELSRALALDDQRLAGRLAGAFRLGGTAKVPIVSGDLVVDGGRYENFVTGTVLRDLSARLTAEETQRLTAVVSATDGRNGRLSATGNVDLTDLSAPRIEAGLNAINARLIRRDDVDAALNADLAYRGGLTKGAISGRIDTQTVEVRLKSGLPPSVAILPVREVNCHGQRSATEQAGEAPAVWVASLAVDLAVPRQMFVRGRGLDSEWAGRLRIEGTTEAPRISGTINLVRGNFEFAGKRFALQRGTIQFFGGEEIDPTLDLVAQYQSSDIQATIRVSGTAAEPKLELTSQPPLPESEILSRVLFGRGTARLGPVEAAQLALALDTLASGDSLSEDVFGYLRGLLGLDVPTLQSGPEGSELPQLSVGRYVGDQVYIGARQGAGSGTSEGAIEIEVLPGVSISSDIGQSQNGMRSSVGVQWRYDY